MGALCRHGDEAESWFLIEMEVHVICRRLFPGGLGSTGAFFFDDTEILFFLDISKDAARVGLEAKFAGLPM